MVRLGLECGPLTPILPTSIKPHPTLPPAMTGPWEGGHSKVLSGEAQSALEPAAIEGRPRERRNLVWLCRYSGVRAKVGRTSTFD